MSAFPKFPYPPDFPILDSSGYFAVFFSDVVLWRKVFCSLLLHIKCLDPMLTFSENSGKALVDLLMALLELFSKQVKVLPLNGLLLSLRWVGCIELLVSQQ